jgi:hypothetical protein
MGSNQSFEKLKPNQYRKSSMSDILGKESRYMKKLKKSIEDSDMLETLAKK